MWTDNVDIGVGKTQKMNIYNMQPNLMKIAENSELYKDEDNLNHNN